MIPCDFMIIYCLYTSCRKYRILTFDLLWVQELVFALNFNHLGSGWRLLWKVGIIIVAALSRLLW